MDLINTRILIISDTHGLRFGEQGWKKPSQHFDIVIHCGDLTQESKLAEFQASIELLTDIDAELKLVIAGNHEITLDDEIFKQHVQGLEGEEELIEKVYGELGQARSLLKDSEGIVFLEEGTHHFTLANGAALKVYASPFTPIRTGDEGTLGSGWAFQYPRHQGHNFDIQPDTDIVITHGPPLGIMDQTSEGRAGCPDLFKAVARAQPQLHCFGHIHPGWGAKSVAWRGADMSVADVSHFTAIDNSASEVVQKLTDIKTGRFDDEESALEKKVKLAEYLDEGYVDVSRPSNGRTMFVNAAVEGSGEVPIQPPIAVELQLSRAPV